jgi:DNA-binding CsgD family transcriptional regulator
MLTRADLQRILVLALEAGAAGTREEFAEITVDGAATLVRSDVVTYNELDESVRPSVLAANPRDTSAWDFEAFGRLAHQNPLIDHYRRTGDGRALKFSDFVSLDELRALELHEAFYAPLGIDYQIAMTLPAPKPTVIGVAFNRGDRDFGEHDRATLNLLRPHLAAAHRRIVEREQLQARVEALERGLDEVTEGVVLLAPDGRVEHASARARQLLGPALGPRLPEHVEGLHMRRVGGEEDTGVVVVSRTPPSAAHGLTPRELEVLASIADGLTAGEVGDALAISRRTVEQHLANAYGKLGVRTQAGAVARVFGVR